MKAHAALEFFEEAARCRDSILALRKLSDKQKIVTNESSDFDAIALYNDGVCGVMSILSVQEGKLTAKNDLLFSCDECVDSASVCAFLCGYYADSSRVPKKLLLSFALEDEDLSLLSRFLSEQRKKKVEIQKYLCPLNKN
jgi:excinuclease ABC subunit C